MDATKHPPIIFTEEDFTGVLPHEDDPVVISVVTAGYNVKRVPYSVSRSLACYRSKVPYSASLVPRRT